MSSKLGILITNYKAWPVTEKGVSAALEHGGAAVGSVLIVDDCSDAPDRWAGDPRVRIHRNATNLGYVRSVNAGMAMMREDIVVMLDCDARPLTPFADVVNQAFDADEKLGAIGFAQTDDTGVLRRSGEICPFALEFLIGPAFWNRLPQSLRQMLSPKSSFLCIHSCCFAIRRSAFNEVSGFDESFDFLDADMDFSISLNRHGWRTGLTSEVVCFHPGGGSPQSTTTRVLRLHRNRLRLLRKHGLLRNVPIAKACLATRHLIEIAMLLASVVMGRSQARDKLDCRWKLLRGVFNDYQPTSN